MISSASSRTDTALTWEERCVETGSDLKLLAARRTAFYQEHAIPEEKQDPVLVYRNDPVFRSIVNRIVERERIPVMRTLFSNPKIQRFFNQHGSLFTEDELRSVAECGPLKNDGQLGGLLAAVVHADPEYDYKRFLNYASLRAHGTVIDHVRTTLGRHPVARAGKEKLHFTASLNNHREDQTRDNLSDPDGIYLLCSQKEDLGLMHALNTLPEDQQERLGVIFDSLKYEGATMDGGKKDQVAKQDLSDLKRAWCRLDDDHLPKKLVDLRYRMKEADTPEKRALVVKELRRAFCVRNKELGAWVGVSESRVNQMETNRQTNGALLDTFGITEWHLSKSAARGYPECWTDKRIAEEKTHLLTIEKESDLAGALHKILIASTFRHPEQVAEHCGERNAGVKSCIASFKKGMVPERENTELQAIFAATGITSEMLKAPHEYQPAERIGAYMDVMDQPSTPALTIEAAPIVPVTAYVKPETAVAATVPAEAAQPLDTTLPAHDTKKEDGASNGSVASADEPARIETADANMPSARPVRKRPYVRKAANSVLPKEDSVEDPFSSNKPSLKELALDIVSRGLSETQKTKDIPLDKMSTLIEAVAGSLAAKILDTQYGETLNSGLSGHEKNLRRILSKSLGPHALNKTIENVHLAIDEEAARITGNARARV